MDIWGHCYLQVKAPLTYTSNKFLAVLQTELKHHHFLGVFQDLPLTNINHFLFWAPLYLRHVVLCFSYPLLFCINFFIFSFHFLEKGEGRDKERDVCLNVDVREKHWLIDFHKCPDHGLNPQPRHMPWLRTKQVTFWFAGWCPTNYAKLVRAIMPIIY